MCDCAHALRCQLRVKSGPGIGPAAAAHVRTARQQERDPGAEGAGGQGGGGGAPQHLHHSSGSQPGAGGAAAGPRRPRALHRLPLCHQVRRPPLRALCAMQAVSFTAGAVQLPSHRSVAEHHPLWWLWNSWNKRERKSKSCMHAIISIRTGCILGCVMTEGPMGISRRPECHRIHNQSENVRAE